MAIHKICRKAGEFADAIGVAVDDPGRGVFRLVASTATGAPLVLEDIVRAEPADLSARLHDAGFAGDDYARTLAVVALRRALAEADAA